MVCWELNFWIIALVPLGHVHPWESPPDSCNISDRYSGPTPNSKQVFVFRSVLPGYLIGVFPTLCFLFSNVFLKFLTETPHYKQTVHMTSQHNPRIGVSSNTKIQHVSFELHSHNTALKCSCCLRWAVLTPYKNFRNFQITPRPSRQFLGCHCVGGAPQLRSSGSTDALENSPATWAV